LAAVTLRLYMPAAAMLHLDDMQAYRAIAWLAWVPNLAAAELLLWLRSPRTSPRLATSAQTPG
jgi:hypothetical protein